jgi:peptidoglycan glycosyltransferase
VRRAPGINDAIGRLAAVFTILFLILAARQVWVQVVEGSRLASDPHNPRASLLLPYRGAIVARDGTVLAKSTSQGRVYPLGPALAQTLGYVSERYGTTGLEATFDRDLRGRAAANDPETQWRGMFGARDAGFRRGSTIVTTIDPSVQATLYTALSNWPRAAGVAIDPRTGEVLAIASVPSFDPATIDAHFKTISHDTQSPLVNRALAGLYPPGSSFKIVTAADALDAGIVMMNSIFVDNGKLKVGNFTFHDDEDEQTGTQTLVGAFALSSNVDFGRIALELGDDRWLDYAHRWKLGDPIDFTLPTELDHLPSPDEMAPGILAQLGFGEADLLVTPMRMALVGATIASGGTEPRPYLVRFVRARDGSERSYAPATPLANPIPGSVADEVRILMEACVNRGTGTAAALPGVQVAGKTGTATIATGRSHAWFVAFAPADAPRVAVAIVVENGGYGGVAAAPIARRVLATALARSKT